jgi:outer membrane protein assembly factor BamB
MSSRDLTGQRDRRRAGRRLAVCLSVVGLVAGASALAPSAAHASGLTMTSFSPTSGPVGTKVTISGSRFTSSDIVQFNGTQAAPVKASADGSTLQVSVPVFATSGAITVTDPATGQTVGLPGTVFQVTPGLFLSPTHVWPGLALVVEASGLTPNRSETILLGKRPIGVVDTNANGDFRLGVTVPFDATAGKSRIGVYDPNIVLTHVIFVLADWPQYQHDAAHSAFDSYDTTISTANVASLKTKWNKQAESTLVGGSSGAPSPPAVAYGMVYFVDSLDYDASCTCVYAWRFSDGHGMWQAGPVESTFTPAVDNGAVFVVGANQYGGTVYAYDAFSGTPLWSVAVGAATPPTAANNTLYVGTSNQSVIALDESTGATLWTYTTGGAIVGAPAEDNGVVYVGSGDHGVYALNATTGAFIWKHATAGAVETSPVVVGTRVYVGSDDGSVYDLRTTNGSKVWSYASGSPTTGALAVTGGTVFAHNTTKECLFTATYVFALDATTGTAKWPSPECVPRDAYADNSAIANGVYYDGPAAFDAANGNYLASIGPTSDEPGPIAAAPADGWIVLSGFTAPHGGEYLTDFAEAVSP